MLFAFVVFAFYFVIGVVVALCFWAVKIRFGNSEGLDPKSFLVRVFTRPSRTPVVIGMHAPSTMKPLGRSLSAGRGRAKGEVFDLGTVLEIQLRDRQPGRDRIMSEIRRAFEETHESATTASSPKYRIN